MYLTETYMDDLNRKGAKKYEGEPIYRIIGFVDVDGKEQMYTVGIGARNSDSDDEGTTNSFTPAVRSARYTTEESLVFLSRDAASQFFRKFRLEYADDNSDFNLKKFRVAQYNPFHEIISLIPVETPIGDAFVTEQKVIKKAYDTPEDTEDAE